MLQDVTILLLESETVAKLYLQHPEWFNEDGQLIRPRTRRLKGGLDFSRDVLDTSDIRFTERLDSELTASGKPDKTGVIKIISKAGHHLKSILQARSGAGENMQNIILSHDADYKIARRDLESALSEKKINLPPQCMENLDIAYMIATSPSEIHKEWRERAASKDYAKNNIPQAVASRY